VVSPPFSVLSTLPPAVSELLPSALVPSLDVLLPGALLSPQAAMDMASVKVSTRASSFFFFINSPPYKVLRSF
jgi:hypothetical protein